MGASAVRGSAVNGVVNGSPISVRTRRQVRSAVELLALAASYPLFAREAELQHPGDTLSELAGRHGLSWAELLAASAVKKPRVRVKAMVAPV
ncbi:LysM domain-containing protein [Rhodovarius crocodyli]|uniref:LysM domain-containing protein n=1 Tax=Rhodovarius crocodyli TaxID=1979269 RepID=A0A437M2E5_9PROT|nr:LysM domain-containing protein [Rhodovarius crocodyli]